MALQKGWQANGCDVTGFCDPYNVTDHVDGVQKSERRRIFIIGDPNDVTIEGVNFRDGVTAQLEKDGQTTALASLTRISATRLRAVVPRELAAGSYDLVLRNPGATGSGRLSSAYTVFASGVDDFFVGPEDIWTNPRTVRTGDTVQLGLNLHRRGGKASVQVAVAFYLGDPAAGGTLLGRRTSVPIAP